MGYDLQTARFITTVAKKAQIPEHELPEVAFAGKSNAGKSSAINKLCQRNRLAHASKTPGRTQALNYFGLGPVNQEPESYLVDTPGYGYAKVPEHVKRDWQGLAGWYLHNRRNLRGFVLMIDIRRGLTQLDVDLLGWVPADVERLLLVTKADKLGKQAQRKAMDNIQQQYLSVQREVAANFMLFSSTKGIGIDPARRLILQWLQHDPSQATD